MGRSAMGSNERKAQLLTIMRAHRERATCISEFSRTGIAREAGVTPQYLSMLIGPEYQAAAQGLTGKRRSSDESLGRAVASDLIPPRSGSGEPAAPRRQSPLRAPSRGDPPRTCYPPTDRCSDPPCVRPGRREAGDLNARSPGSM
jgi:hypothetical protein